jgi:hypothetical protein
MPALEVSEGGRLVSDGSGDVAYHSESVAKDLRTGRKGPPLWSRDLWDELASRARDGGEEFGSHCWQVVVGKAGLSGWWRRLGGSGRVSEVAVQGSCPGQSQPAQLCSLHVSAVRQSQAPIFNLPIITIYICVFFVPVFYFICSLKR